MLVTLGNTLGNKIDRQGAAGEDELRQVFGLYGQTTGNFAYKIKGERGKF